MRDLQFDAVNRAFEMETWACTLGSKVGKRYVSEQREIDPLFAKAMQESPACQCHYIQIRRVILREQGWSLARSF